MRVPFAPLPLISLLAVLGGWALVVGGAAFYTGPDGATWRAKISGGGEAVLQQTLRYSRLGECPAAWPVGAHTDRRGRMQPDARWVREARARWP